MLSIDDTIADRVIEKLLEVLGSKPNKNVDLAEDDIKGLCIQAKEILLAEPTLLELKSPMKICGGIYGYYYDLLRIFETQGFPPETKYLFLGDYAHYHKFSLETICLLLAFKVRFPENIFMIRGRHETASMSRFFGFYDHCKRRYNIKMWKAFVDVFNCIPAAAVVDKKIFCVHGGLSPDLKNIKQILEIERPIVVPDTGILCDLIWATPEKDIKGWTDNDSGVSYYFGSDIVEDFLINNNLDLICRAQQIIEEGYEFFAGEKLVTVFSIPDYRELGNSGAIINVDENRNCSYQILKPNSEKKSVKIKQDL